MNGEPEAEAMGGSWGTRAGKVRSEGREEGKGLQCEGDAHTLTHIHAPTAHSHIQHPEMYNTQRYNIQTHTHI